MNGNVWAWGHLMKHRAARVLSLDYAIGRQITQPSTACVRFTRHPVLKKRSKEEILMIHRRETEWRHWLLSAAKGYKEAYPKSLHCCQPRGTEERWGVTSLLCDCRGCWTQHCLDRGIPVADGQPGDHCLGAVRASREHIPGAQSMGTPWECEQKLKFCFEVCSKYNQLPRRSSTGTCYIVDRMLQ